MRKKRKSSGEDILERLREQEDQNDRETFQGQHHQSINNQVGDEFANVNMTDNPFDDDTFDHSSSPSETPSQQKEESLLIRIRDTCTRDITTRKMVASQVWHLEKTKKVIVEINGNGQGNDNGANLLVRFLGQLAQKSAFCPISVERWDWMSEKNSKDQWMCIEGHFEFDYAVGIKWATSTLGERWKAYKYRLRCQHFYPNKSKEEILSNPPSGVDSIDWAAFVHHYTKDQMKKQSDQNTTNRKKLKISHAGGSKSNARRGRQMELQLGRPVCRGEVKLSTLLKKNGNYVNNEGKTIADKISEVLPEDQERVATLGVPSKINAYPDGAIGKVYGAEHLGRVRGLGVGTCPTDVFGTFRHFTEFISAGSSSQKNVEDLQKQVQTLEEKLNGYEETKEQLTQTQEQLSQTNNQLAILHNFLLQKFGDELPILN